MFSGLSKELAIALNEELFGCMKYINLRYDELMRMPTKYRKFYIKRHNDTIREENSRNNGETYSNIDAINGVADMAMHRMKK